MVMNTSTKELEMTTTQTSAKTFRNAILAGAATFAALAGVNSANALPPFPFPINLPPVASFTATPNPVAVGDNAVFNGSASRDVDGHIAKYEWDLNADGVFETRSTVFSTANRRYATPGTVTVKLRVTDNGGKTNTTSRTLTVHAKPVALLTADRAVPTAGETVTYRATGSYDPDAGGFIREYLWDLDGNGTFERSTGTSQFVSMSFPTAGQKKIALRVIDRYYAFTDQPLFIRVNRRPTAVISATPNPAVVNQPVALSGAASTDDRTIVKYEWDLNGDGTYETNTATSPSSSTMLATLGQVKVGLQVTDDDGAVDQSVATLTVNPAPVFDTTPPRVTITPTRVRMVGGTATFKVTCPMSELRCDTKLTLKGRFGTLKGKVLGSAREMIPGGETLQITVPLSTKAKKAIRRYGLVKATAIATAIDDAGNTGTVKKFVRITKR
jgi:PKD domain-containing protein